MPFNGPFSLYHAYLLSNPWEISHIAVSLIERLNGTRGGMSLFFLPLL